MAHAMARPYASFSEAVESVFGVLAHELPPCRLVLGRLDHEEGEYQVVEARGSTELAIEAGYSTRLATSLCLHMAEDSAPRVSHDAGADAIYGELPMRTEFGIRGYAAVPLELSDGTRVASLAAMSAGPAVFHQAHLDMLTMCARLLSYEWERVAKEVLLRRLVAQQRDRDTTDTLTGIPNRTTFSDKLLREWELASRGSVESFIVACRVEVPDCASGDKGDPMRDLVLKDAAGALAVTARKTDVIGRVGDDMLAAVLVGCKGEAGASAFCERFRSALERATHDRGEHAVLSMAIRPLTPARDAEELLEWADAEAQASIPDVSEEARTE